MEGILDLYCPLTNNAKFERDTSPLPPFEHLSEGLVIIASGSPRNRRVLEALPKQAHVVELSSRLVKDLLSRVTLPPGASKIAEAIVNYREPRKQWRIDEETGEATDSNLSLNKARMTLAATLLIDAQNQVRPRLHFCMMTRDYNVANQEGVFVDRPGYSYLYENKIAALLEGWVQEGTDAEPVEPVEQYHQLYGSAGRKGREFYITNSTALMDVTLEGTPALTEIKQLIDLRASLPPWASHKKLLTFMAMRPTSDVSRIAPELISFYAGKPLGHGGEMLYMIPGIVDWARLQKYLSIWLPNESKSQDLPIITSFRRLHESVNSGAGSWQPFTEIAARCPDTKHELVGQSTFAIRQLFITP